MSAGTYGLLGVFLIALGLPGWAVTSMEEKSFFIAYTFMLIMGFGLLIACVAKYLDENH